MDKGIASTVYSNTVGFRAIKKYGIPAGNDGSFVLVACAREPISSSLPGHFLKLSEVYFGRLHLLPLSLSVGFCEGGACRSTPTDPFNRGVALGADCSRLMSASFGHVAVIMAEP